MVEGEAADDPSEPVVAAWELVESPAVDAELAVGVGNDVLIGVVVAGVLTAEVAEVAG